MSRYATVGAVSHARDMQYEKGEADEFFKFNEKYLWRAAKAGCDILAFPEVYYRPNGDYYQAAEELGGESTTWAMEMARKYSMYIIWPIIERKGDTIWNSCFLFDREGGHVGTYHKMNPTIGEIENGVRPGEEASVFDIEFGRIGMAICFDLNFRNIFEGLRDNGAEAIFFCSAYRGGHQLLWWAQELGCYIIAAIRAEFGRIVDLTGQQLELSTYESLVTHRININRRLLHMDYNWDKMDAMLEKYGTDLTFDYVTQEAKYAIGSEREGLDIEAVIDEFGLMRLPEYWECSNAKRAEAIAKPADIGKGPASAGCARCTQCNR